MTAVLGREAHLVELVSADGRAVGQSTVDGVHRAPGQLHRAFSVLLTDTEGRLLLQKRAGSKTRFALRWANTCCGHPKPGESVVASASRRLVEELGIASVSLVEVGVYVYRASDPASGRVEHEYDHVLAGTLGGPAVIAANPAEVAAVEWIHPAQLTANLNANPGAYAPWLDGVLATWRART